MHACRGSGDSIAGTTARTAVGLGPGARLGIGGIPFLHQHPRRLPRGDRMAAVFDHALFLRSAGLRRRTARALVADAFLHPISACAASGRRQGRGPALVPGSTRRNGFVIELAALALPGAFADSSGQRGRLDGRRGDVRFRRRVVRAAGAEEPASRLSQRRRPTLAGRLGGAQRRPPVLCRELSMGSRRPPKACHAAWPGPRRSGFSSDPLMPPETCAGQPCAGSNLAR